MSNKIKVLIGISATCLTIGVNAASAGDNHSTKMPQKIHPLASYEIEFDTIDNDKSGGITYEESTREHELSRSYYTVDTNDDGEVSKNEYKAYYDERYKSIANTRPLRHLSTQDKNNTFKQYDTNGDGMLSIEEYAYLVDAGSDGIPDDNQRKPSGAAHTENEMDPDPK